MRARKHKEPPPRLRRSESFLGIHFDFHASEDCTQVGATVTPALLDAMLRKVRPDYVQCDCKGHPGISSYPTRVGTPAPGFVRDPLRIWRDATARRGVGLYMHYSGVFDTAALKGHPDWALLDAKGDVDPNNASVFGPYVDRLLIPQLKELHDGYGVDGVWVDGECWATCQDYRPAVLAAFRKATGIRSIPRKSEDRYFFEFTQFCREGFRRYLRHYVDALHAHDPEFEVASNWAFSSFMPEPVTAGVDFISGDLPLANSVRAARYEARCMMRQGKPWDLMAWGFSSVWKEINAATSTKSAVQLQQEASIVLALGGGFQVYFKQNRDASIELWEMDIMAEVAEFCRARQELCHRAEAVPQVGLIFSTAAFYRKTKRVFGAWDGELTPLRGVLDSLMDAGQVVEIVSEHHLTDRIAEYPLLIVPEWEFLEDDFRKALLAYGRAGGNLLLIGPHSARLFERELGVTLSEPESKPRFLSHRGRLCGLITLGCDAVLRSGTQAIGGLHASNNPNSPSSPAASVRKCGRGRIAAIYTNLGERYFTAGTALARDFLAEVVGQLFPKPIATRSGSHSVDLSLMRKDGVLSLHLVNTAGPHSNEKVYTFDEIPPIGPLEITLRLPARPRCLSLEPGGQKLPFKWSQGIVRTTVPQLSLHAAVTVR